MGKLLTFLIASGAMIVIVQQILVTGVIQKFVGATTQQQTESLTDGIWIAIVVGLFVLWGLSYFVNWFD